MKGRISPSIGRRYPLTLICEVYQVARSSVYAARASVIPMVVAIKRGPKTTWSEEEVVEGIRAVIAGSPFHGEGYRKVRARLAH